jgi:hypothetical protein
MITRADKGNTIVILPITQYENKVQDFIRNNEFQTKPTDPTKTYQAQLRKLITKSLTLIPKEHRWKYVNMNPSAPTIKGLIKLHKPNQPIRPVVNWQNAPSNRLVWLFTDTINHITTLPHAFNIKNTRPAKTPK